MQNKKTLIVLALLLIIGVVLVILQLQFTLIDLDTFTDRLRSSSAGEREPDRRGFDAANANLPAVPLFPLSTSTVSTRQPTFFWEEVKNVQSYLISIWRDEPNLFKVEISYLPPIAGCEESICSYTSSYFLEENITYFWTITSILDTGEETTSAAKAFTIKPFGQQVPVLAYPANGNEITVGTTILKWRPVDATRYYRIELFRPDGNRMDSIKVSSSLCTTPTTCTYKLPYHLEQAYGEYQWRVQALHESPALVSQWSEKGTFQYIQLDPLVPLSPVDNAAVTSNTPIFSWAESQNTAFKYDLQIFKATGELVDSVSLLPETICTSNICSWQSRKSLPEGNYKWRVLAKSYPNLSKWTDSWFFTIQ